ncbi:hypothetical protein FGB62_139g221 [Gracilaria domingensis]|nr:hypothetical protein FGB62_139g221 [Gracilaria domingensis]
MSDFLSPQHHLHVPSADNQLGTPLDHRISDQLTTTLLSPLLSDPLSPTFMASADNHAPYSPSPGAEYQDADEDISHIQAVASPSGPQVLAQDEPLQEQTDHVAPKGSTIADSFKADQNHIPEEPRQDQRPVTHTFSPGNEVEQNAAQISVQPVIQKSQKRLKRGPYMCKLCRGYGHTAKTCTKRRNPTVHRALNAFSRRDQYFPTLIAIEEVSRKTPKEQLYLHYEAVMTAIYQLSLSAFRRSPFQRDKALAALIKCLEAERLIASCISAYKEASSRLATVISGKENVENYTAPIKQHPEFISVVNETKRCLYRAISAMRNADFSIRNILSSSHLHGANKRPEALVGSNSNEFTVKQNVQQAGLNQEQEESGGASARKQVPYMFQTVDKPDVLNLEDEGCIPSAPTEFRGNTQQQIDSSFRDIDLFMSEEKSDCFV